MRLEALRLRDQLVPGARHRRVVLARDAGACCDPPDPLRQPGESLFMRIPARECPRDDDVALVREIRAVDAPRLEVSQKGTVRQSTK